MKRRQFLHAAGLGAIALGAGAAAGSAWLGSGPAPQVLTIDAALRHIDTLSKGTISTSGRWNAFQVFSHCAQTVEFSMVGYPAPKSALFQDTAGKLAFAAFSAKQKMKHGLAEPIAGAPVLAAVGDPREALERLRKAFTAFQQFEGTLAPHFAYGALSKAEYELAHTLHFSNHLEEIQAAS
jgi:hypothetical protein